MNTEDFFENLPALTDFNLITSSSYYRAIPEDWFLYITDVKGSTQAIKEGRYKDVNTLGAACILIARNVMKKKDFPFVFGGDGATLAIPENKAKELDSELVALRELAKENFKLDLRIGKVSIKEIKAQNLTVEVANYQITSGQNLALLRGNGLPEAEKWIKTQREKYEVMTSNLGKVDLSQLSCRWQPVPNKRGKIISLIITSRMGDNIYEKILKDFRLILPEGIESHNPVNYESGTYKTLDILIKEEVRLHKNLFNFKWAKRLFEIVAAVIIFKLKLPIPIRKSYIQSLPTHSDFRKFDNAIRMILDCSQDQISKMEKVLQIYHTQGDIFYGTYLAENCLMTCLFEGLNQGQHLHFIDGDNGGYAMAAIQLKDQMKAAALVLPEKS